MMLGHLLTEEKTDKMDKWLKASHIDNVSLVSLEGSGMIGIPGFSKRLFESLSREKINGHDYTASSEHSICIGLRSEDAQNAKAIIDEEFAFEIFNKVNLGS